MSNEWSRVSLFFLFIVAFLGTLLRSAAFVSLPFEYVNLLHAHSHVAFQGWVYTFLMLLLPKMYLNESQIKKGRYRLQFRLTVLVVAAILIAFSWQGYARYSIFFSTLFQLLNYWFIFGFLRDLNASHSPGQDDISVRFVQTGMWLGLLSTLLPIGIGLLSAKGQSGSEAYRSLVYTFLHLQYNGWFLFVVLGLFYRYLGRIRIAYGHKFATRFHYLLSLAAIPSISLSLLGMAFSEYIIPVAYASAALLAAALLFFIRSLPVRFYALFVQRSYWLRVYLFAFIASFVLKMILQSLSVLPPFRTYAAYNKFIIIAYLHLSLIGSISFLLLAMLVAMKWIVINGWFKLGSTLFITGFLMTETLLSLAGLGLFHSNLILAMGSAAMALGVLTMIVNKRTVTDSDAKG